MSEWTKQQLSVLSAEWTQGSRFVLANDLDHKDHLEIQHWVARFIEESVSKSDDEREYIFSLIYHSLNFDIPFEATRSVRDELLHIVRAKLQADRDGE